MQNTINGTARRLRNPKNFIYKKYLCSKPNSQPPKETEGTSPRNAFVEKCSKIAQDASVKLQEKGSAAWEKSFDKVKGYAGAFDDILGISEVRDAQSNVRQAENEFMETRKRVQTAKKELEFMHNRLADVRRRLDRTPRDDERYLALATEEHRILLEERKLKADFGEMENLERDQFAVLSGIVRDSHEKERARAERTKYWSVVGSVVGAALGIIGSSVMNYIRLKEIKSAVKGTGQSLMEKSDKMQELISTQDSVLTKHQAEIAAALSTHQEEVTASLSDLREAVDTYALSASIGTDIGTIETGISLKTLTAQLRELVQLQLASEREKAEEKMETKNTGLENTVDAMLQKQTDLTATCLEILSKLNNTINQGVNLQDDIKIQQLPRTDIDEEFKQQLKNATWWAKFGTGMSLSIGIFSLSAVMYDIFS